MSARARMARSRAEEIWSSAGRPLGLTKVDCVMPRRRACWFIVSAKFSIEPETPSASTTAMSFDERTISIFSALSAVTRVPGGESHLDRLLRGRGLRDRQRLVESEPAVPDRAQHRIGGHDLGDGGRIPRIAGVLGEQHLVPIRLRSRAAPRPTRASRSARCGAGDGRPHQGPGNGWSRRKPQDLGSDRLVGPRNESPARARLSKPMVAERQKREAP